MGNAFRVLKRDVLRLAKVPPAMVVVLALLVLPSLYTWYNVIGFWDPYDNTGNVRVDVVNLDAGGASELTGELHVGDMLVEELGKNTQLGWTFTDYDSAMDELQSGTCYAVFVVPEDFTENLLSLTTGDFTQPNLQYYVNEKTGPVAPKITDTGATTLDETINSTFVSTVSDAAAKAIDDAYAKSRDELAASQSEAGRKVGAASDAVGEARSKLSEISAASETAQGKVSETKGSLGSVRDRLSETSEGLSRVSSQASNLQTKLTDFSASAMPALNQSLAALSQTSTKMNDAVQKVNESNAEAQASVSATIAQATIAAQEGEALAAQLREYANELPDTEASKQQLLALAGQLQTNAQQAQQNLEGLQEINDGLGEASAEAAAASSAFDTAAQGAVVNMQGYSDILFKTTIPAINSSLAQLSSSSAQLSTAVSNQKTLIDQASLVLDQLNTTLGAARDALSQTDGLLADFQADLDTVRTDVTALSQSDLFTTLFGEDGLNAAEVAEFMGSPTQVETEQLYELNAYGSAMAPLFMNLTFWIGAFMLVVILRQEVDEEGIRGLTLAQRYLGRFMLFAVLAVGQALICCAGVLFIGVQAVSVPALFFAAAVASLAYLSIIYALSITLQHIGKGICIVLVFAQIPGATGLYPVEMTTEFFQAVYPLMPFTYGIGAMREAICGFYGWQYAHDVAVLGGISVAFMAIGILVRPLMANVNLMVAKQVHESGLFNGEKVEVPFRPYKISQLMQALSDKEVFQDEIRARYERFDKLYPRLIHGAVGLGLGVPVVLAEIFYVAPAEKTTLLTAWLAWFVFVVVFLIVVESLRNSINRQMELGGMSTEGVQSIFAARDTVSDDADATRPLPSLHLPGRHAVSSYMKDALSLRGRHARGAEGAGAHGSRGAGAHGSRGGGAHGSRGGRRGGGRDA